MDCRPGKEWGGEKLQMPICSRVHVGRGGSTGLVLQTLKTRHGNCADLRLRTFGVHMSRGHRLVTVSGKRKDTRIQGEAVCAERGVRKGKLSGVTVFRWRLRAPSFQGGWKEVPGGGGGRIEHVYSSEAVGGGEKLPESVEYGLSHSCLSARRVRSLCGWEREEESVSVGTIVREEEKEDEPQQKAEEGGAGRERVVEYPLLGAVRTSCCFRGQSSGRGWSSTGRHSSLCVVRDWCMGVPPHTGVWGGWGGGGGNISEEGYKRSRRRGGEEGGR